MSEQQSDETARTETAVTENLGLTIARCDDRAAHPTHVWTPAPRAINGPKRCPGVAAVERTAEALRVIQKTADKQGNVTMLRLAENIANDAALVRMSQAEGWDAAIQEAEDRGLLCDAFADEIRGRNPYRDSSVNRTPPEMTTTTKEPR